MKKNIWVGISAFILACITLYIRDGVLAEKPAQPAPQQQEQQQLVPHVESTGTYKVVQIVDGDTFKIDLNGKKETIRLIGVDTPETVDPRKPVQCFGKEASAKAKELLTNATVRLERDPSQGDVDKYNRLLRYVYLENGMHFNKLMIEEGYAHEYTYDLPYAYQKEFKAAQKSAQEQKRGLWGSVCST